MIGALWTGITGLSGAQRALDNESNNIANVNTIGYKASRIAFSDQIYQDNIGKGVSTFDVEKLYTQGNLKVTGVDYDMALSGDGFFQVSDGKETYYSRAGNFRMGQNGTLQNAGGYAVQGWAMSPLDTTDSKQFVSTDGNAKQFTNDYSKILGNVVIRNTTKIDTIAAKATDYTETATTDDNATYSGAGYKTQSTKISDTELLITEYNKQLNMYANADPKPTATDSKAQKDLLDFQLDGTDLDGGDEIYIYVDGTKYSQSFDTDEETTMRLLTDKISNIAGFNAYMTNQAHPDPAGTDPMAHDPIIVTKSDIDDDNGGAADGNDDDTWGSLVIESLIPGRQFRVTEYGYDHDGGVVKGEIKPSLQVAVQGTGLGAIKAVEDALSEAVAGKQSDVFTPKDLDTKGDGTGRLKYTLLANSYGQGIPAADIQVVGADDTVTPAEIAAKINEGDVTDSTKLSYYLDAYVINDNLVIKPTDKFNDKEINAIMVNDQDKDDDTTKDIDIPRNPLKSGVQGAGAEFMSITTSINQTSSKNDIQLRLDSLALTDSAFGDFRVDDTGLVTMKQDGIDFAVGQVAVAKFTDNRGLEPSGNNLLKSTNRSGNAIFNINNDKTALIKGGTLELSTADLSESLVNLMVFQRAFEANSKSITTADQILTTLIQLKK